MTSQTALQPFDPAKKTFLVIDTSPFGIVATVYQEELTGAWLPNDHASRSLTSGEQNYHQIEKESLAIAWSMNIHCYYLLEIHFDCCTDHQPLIPIYCKGTKKGPARVEPNQL